MLKNHVLAISFRKQKHFIFVEQNKPACNGLLSSNILIMLSSSIGSSTNNTIVFYVHELVLEAPLDNVRSQKQL